MDYDIPGTTQRESRLRGADQGRTCADTSSGLDKPDIGGRDEKRPTCVRSLLIGMKELCRDNGLSEAFTVYLVGQLALDLCDSDPPNMNSVI